MYSAGVQEKGTDSGPSAICRNGRQLERNFCAFWRKEQTNPYIQAFSDVLQGLLAPES